MSTITLEAIKAEQTKLAEMIAKLEAQAASVYHFPEALIDLRPGEHYAGIIIGQDGEPSHHVILMAGQPTDELNWQAALDWAKRIDGELPTRREQALLYANCKEQFEGAWYWSSEQHAANSVSAWFQHFDNGYQYDYYKSAELRARAVRRLTIQ
ncbi:MAG: DUF1566 domain-containing protein [Burkholderiaceae bacterium]|nr:DUF1566 domain-containing protein [Burkholderiaceae bacterium]